MEEEEGDLDDWCWIANISSPQQQGPGMNILLLNTMYISKYESPEDLAKSIFWNTYLYPTQFGPLNLWHEDTQGYYLWLEVEFLDNSKKNKKN